MLKQSLIKETNVLILPKIALFYVTMDSLHICSLKKEKYLVFLSFFVIQAPQITSSESQPERIPTKEAVI